MSTNLLPVGSFNKIPLSYIQLVIPDTPSEALSCEHNRVLYIATMNSGYTSIRIQKLNLITNEITVITDISKSILGNFNIGCICADDNNLYIKNSSNTSTNRLYILNLKTLAISLAAVAPKIFNSNGKIIKTNNGLIVASTSQGFMFYNPKTDVWVDRYQATNSYKFDFAVGEKLFVSTNQSTSATILVYRIWNDTLFTFDLPTANITAVCYDSGKFYFANNNNLYIYDELTETIIQQKTIPWTNVKTLDITNNVLLATQSSSPQVYLYDILEDYYLTQILQWSMTAYSNDSLIQRVTAFKGLFFIPHITLCIIRYSEKVKYNMGYKFTQTLFPYNISTQENYTYDPAFVEFNDTYVTIKDGIKELPLEVVSGNIKKISLKKGITHNVIKSLTFK